MKKIMGLIGAVVVGLVLSACGTVQTVQHPENNITMSKTIYVDAAFTKEEQQLIQAGVDIWNKNTNNVLNFHMIYDFSLKDDSNTDIYRYLNKTIMRRITDDDSITKEIDDEINSELGTDENSRVKILGLDYKPKNHAVEFIFLVADRIEPGNQFINVSAHEVLHSASAEHIDTGPAIMNSQFDYLTNSLVGTKLKPIICITPIDAEQICHLYFCDVKKIKTC